MTLPSALLLVACLAAVLAVGWVIFGEVRQMYAPTSAEQFLHSYVKREIHKAQIGAANAEQWAVDLVKKCERIFP